MTVITKITITYSDLVFSEGVNQSTIDIVDGKTKSHNNHIFDHRCA